ncbi:hypothetical protein [Victivallis sp.]|uniref:hypothetical protein n=1 Tax=Victivallis sp. TaxID=2049020 RepID=UPI003A938EA0
MTEAETKIRTENAGKSGKKQRLNPHEKHMDKISRIQELFNFIQKQRFENSVKTVRKLVLQAEAGGDPVSEVPVQLGERRVRLQLVRPAQRRR